MRRAGVSEIVVARLDDGDVSEDVAAASIAQAVGGEGVHVERAFTGRSNLFAEQAGVLEGLSPIASRVALEAAARLPRGADCLCQSLKSEQPPARYDRV